MPHPASSYAAPHIATSDLQEMHEEPSWKIPATTLAIHALALALPWIALPFFEHAYRGANRDSLGLLSLGIAIAIFAECGLRLARARSHYTLGTQTLFAQHKAALQSCMYGDMRAFRPSSLARWRQAFAAIPHLCGLQGIHTILLLCDGAFIAASATLIAYWVGALVCVPILWAILLGGSLLRRENAFANALQKRREAERQREHCVDEILHQKETIAAFCAEPFIQRHYEARWKQMGIAYADAALLDHYAGNRRDTHTAPAIAALMMLGALTMPHPPALGAMLASTWLAIRMIGTLQPLLLLWVQARTARPLHDQVRTLCTLPRAHATPPAQIIPTYREGRIRLEQVNFRYHAADASLLYHVSLELSPRECIAIHGAPGSGKSSLLRTMAGLELPDAGRVIIDGVEATAIPPHLLPRHVGYLATDAQLFSGTIAQHIGSYGQTSDESVHEAIQMLMLGRDIMQLPHGIETSCDAASAALLAPEVRRRIHMARILALQPRTLLFDHADRAMDKAARQHLYRMMTRIKGHSGLVIVSEDRDLLSLADTHYVLERGRLTRIGHIEHPTAMRFFREIGA